MVPFRDPSAFVLKKSSVFKFSSSERNPTFLYTRSPYTFMNEKIKKDKEIRMLEKGKQHYHIANLILISIF